MNDDKTYGVDIIKELELESLPQEQQDEVVAALSQALQTRITTRVMEVLSEAEKWELEQLVAAGNDQKVGEYIGEKVPGLDAIGYDELQKMRLELKSMNEDILAAIGKFKKE